MGVDLKTEIGIRVKSARKMRNLTQAQLAEAIDKSFETVSNLERGKTAPNFGTLEEIGNALNVELKYFFDFETEPHTVQRSRLLGELSATLHAASDDDLELIAELAKVVAKR